MVFSYICRFKFKFMPMSNPINPVELVKREMARRHMTVTQFAPLIQREYTSAYTMLQKKNMSVERLEACCAGLKYNFFLEIGYKIPYPGPVDKSGNPLVPETSRLQQIINGHDVELADLRQRVKDLEHDKLVLETEVNVLRELTKEFMRQRV